MFCCQLSYLLSPWLYTWVLTESICWWWHLYLKQCKEHDSVYISSSGNSYHCHLQCLAKLRLCFRNLRYRPFLKPNTALSTERMRFLQGIQEASFQGLGYMSFCSVLALQVEKVNFQIFFHFSPRGLGQWSNRDILCLPEVELVEGIEWLESDGYHIWKLGEMSSICSVRCEWKGPFMSLGWIKIERWNYLTDWITMITDFFSFFDNASFLLCLLRLSAVIGFKCVAFSFQRSKALQSPFCI